MFLPLPSQQSSRSSAVYSLPLHKSTSGLGLWSWLGTLYGTFALNTSVRARGSSGSHRVLDETWSANSQNSTGGLFFAFLLPFICVDKLQNAVRKQLLLIVKEPPRHRYRHLREQPGATAAAGAPGWSHDARNSVRTITRRLGCL